jgi:hypothetical protein
LLGRISREAQFAQPLRPVGQILSPLRPGGDAALGQLSAFLFPEGPLGLAG